MNTQGIRMWLDDQRPAPAGWTHVRTSAEAIALLETGVVVEASFDHDLGADEDATGYTVVAWIEQAVVERGFVPPAKMRAHSANAPGHARIEAAIASIYRLAGRATGDGR